MQFTFFHLMPYRPLDMAERHKHRAGWVVLPNALYDPKKGADEYQSYIDQLVYAEKLGFDVIAVNEHHQTAYGMMPAPNLIAARLIARTSKAKIAIIGRALPLVNNPVNIAEEFAMLDNLSRGRIITGFVRGIGNEYHSTGINPFFSHERYPGGARPDRAGLDQARARSRSRASTTISATSTCGRGPTSSRTRRSGFRRWARRRRSSGRRRRSASIRSWSRSAAAIWWRAISTSTASRRRQYGYEASPDQLGWASPVYVADTDERAREEAKAGVETLFNDFLAVPFQMLLPPGYMSLPSMKNTMRMRKALGAHEAPHRRRADRERHRGGRLAHARCATSSRGCATRPAPASSSPCCSSACCSDELTRRNMEMFASEVMPHLQN